MLNNGKDGQYRICSPILQPHVNRYESAVFTIFAFDFLLVCTSLHHICPEQICVNLIFRELRKISTIQRDSNPYTLRY